MNKQKYELICECGKKIIGFSEHHVKENYHLHQSISKEHKERMELIKMNEMVIYSKGLNINQIADLLENNPIIIADIKDIGRVHEKEIMVS